jgi:hypothetical protein
VTSASKFALAGTSSLSGCEDPEKPDSLPRPPTRRRGCRGAKTAAAGRAQREINPSYWLLPPSARLKVPWVRMWPVAPAQ